MGKGFEEMAVNKSRCISSTAQKCNFVISVTFLGCSFKEVPLLRNNIFDHIVKGNEEICIWAHL